MCCKNAIRTSILVLVILCYLSPNLAFSDSLKISLVLWNSLNKEEKETVAENYILETYDSMSYAYIIDVQSIDKSTYNTGTMSKLGSLYGQASYLDSMNFTCLLN